MNLAYVGAKPKFSLGLPPINGPVARGKAINQPQPAVPGVYGMPSQYVYPYGGYAMTPTGAVITPTSAMITPNSTAITPNGTMALHPLLYHMAVGAAMPPAEAPPAGAVGRTMGPALSPQPATMATAGLCPTTTGGLESITAGLSSSLSGSSLVAQQGVDFPAVGFSSGPGGILGGLPGGSGAAAYFPYYSGYLGGAGLWSYGRSQAAVAALAGYYQQQATDNEEEECFSPCRC